MLDRLAAALEPLIQISVENRFPLHKTNNIYDEQWC